MMATVGTRFLRKLWRSVTTLSTPTASMATIAILAGIALPLGVLSPAAVAAEHRSTLCVNMGGTHGCYPAIQAAVNAAPPGATISVAAGTYKESVLIQKPVRLQGAGAATVVDAAGQPNGIVVRNVTAPAHPRLPVAVVSGFTVQNAKLEGILVENSSHVLVANNIVRFNDKNRTVTGPGPFDVICPGAMPFDQDDCGEALHLRGVAFSTVAGNIVERNVGGILLTDETAANHDNLVTHNIVRDNTEDCGITLPSHPSSVSPGPNGPVFGPGHGVYRNTVSYNLSTRNGGAGAGIFAPTPGTAAYDNLVIGNVLTNNGLPGVALHSHAFGQNLNGNTITRNTISGNAADDDAGTAGPTGIVIFSDAKGNAAPIVGTTITHNRISNEAIGVWVGTTATSLAMHHNDLAGTTVGVQNAGTGVVNARINYWGCTTGPGTPGCAAVIGNVLYAPWLHNPPGGAGAR